MVMNLRLRAAPVFYTALGTAAGFYFPAFNNKPVIIIICFSIPLIFSVFFYSLVTFCRFAAGLDMRFKLGRKIRLVSVCFIVFSIGLAAGISASMAGKSDPVFAILPEKVTAIEGVLTEDPRILSGGRAMASVSLRRCASDIDGGFLRATAGGNITVFFPSDGADGSSLAVKIRGFGRGTTVFSEGSLRQSASGYSFSASSIHIVKQAPSLERFRTDIRLGLIERFEKQGEWGGLALALLIGIKDNLDSDLAAMYRRAGCSYILALSGMHLAVLAAIIAFILRKPLGLKPAAVTGAAIICLYCLLVGPMPSLIRACIMYLLGTIAILGFLPRKPLSVLSLSFLIQIIITPDAGHQISFILSYLALFGIFIIGQPLYEIFAGKVPDFLLQPLSASCSAFLATMGVTGNSFGYLAFIGIIAGLFLVPVTTIFMILSLLWLLLDFFSISGFLSLPLSLIYKLMEWIISIAAKVPVLSVSKPAVFIALSLVISIFIIIFEYYQQKKRLKLESF